MNGVRIVPHRVRPPTASRNRLGKKNNTVPLHDTLISLIAYVDTFCPAGLGKGPR